ncbi:endonuclease/exonuclease/phosphatase family protein [Nocardioides lijunqiniae]|uniref:endonuclease/exonuclease/phosphatase family protein n=1 Tax=Nocardioides lijunqiniae TaxID=2760832 RepID=UPI001877CD39|nr:endonuclease/exonuclease/phosphatase family protein [Nocardioides lijunqiniae]
MERLRAGGSSGRSPKGRRALRRARSRLLRLLATLAAVSAISAALVVMFVPSALDAVTSAQETEPRTPSPSPSPETTPSTTPEPSPTATPTAPIVPLPTAAPPIVQYPTVARLDQAMARRGMARVPQTSWQGAQFSVASFNVLGASHTRGPGRRKGYASAEARLPAQLDMLAAKDISVAGLQEFQYPQVNQLRNRTGDTWGIWPGTQLGNWLADNSIIWRTDTWTLVETHTVDVPYFRGKMTAMPYVLLEHDASGRRVWFANFHNPANVAGDARGHRARAVQIEAALAQELSADGTPVVVTGDMNDRAEFACPFANASGMYSPNGAEARESGCALPAKMDVDWIFGTRDLEFSAYQSDASARDRKLSDHPLITASASLPGVEERRDCKAKISRRGVAWYCPTG